MNVLSQSNLSVVRFENLAGWQNDDHAAAFASWSLSCREIVRHGRSFPRNPLYGGRREDWLDLCKETLAFDNLPDRQAARAFFERHFLPVQVRDATGSYGLFTGYFEPEVLGSAKPSEAYHVPIYARPNDLISFNAAQRKSTGLRYGRLVDGLPRGYLTRKSIENGALAGKGLEIVWLKSWADAFFMHIQGSGRVRLPDGGLMRLGFAAKSGLPYTSIGALLVRQGAMSRDRVSMQSIRAWMSDNPDAARELMWKNESFIFFRKLVLDNPQLGPLGAQQVQLTPLRSLAVDRRYWAFGTPLWVETNLPGTTGDVGESFHHLMIAQDTGSAIKKRVRGDIFFGAGEIAARMAGHMKNPGRLFALLPKPVARRLGLQK